MKTYTVTVNNGTTQWYNDQDSLHREDGPAIEYADGGKTWYQNGKLHRDDGPAVEWASVKYWYTHGQLHRTDGPAVVWASGAKYWYQNDQLHREDGPAIEYPGVKQWYQNGKLHRTDGPAFEWADGTKNWYLNGERLTEEEFNRYISDNTIDNEENKEEALRLEACDMIEELINMLRTKRCTPEQRERITEIEDFAANYLGED